MKHHTKEKGDLAVAKIISNLSEKGFKILVPLSEHLPFDLVAYKDNKFYKVQVKFSSIKRGGIVVRFYGSWADKNGTHHSKVDKNLVDLFAVYCPDNDKCYYLLPESFKDMAIFLRTEKTKNHQSSGINLADDYLELNL